METVPSVGRAAGTELQNVFAPSFRESPLCGPLPGDPDYRRGGWYAVWLSKPPAVAAAIARPKVHIAQRPARPATTATEQLVNAH